MDLVVERHVGGMIEYRDILLFRSKTMKAYWKRQVHDERASGSIKHKGKVIFNFDYNRHHSRVQEVMPDQSLGEWTEVDCMIVMCD